MSSNNHESPLIAVDMDDVLCLTNGAAANWHNIMYDTNISITDFHYYHWWKNPGWGTPAETLKKVRLFSNSDEFANTPPVEGALDGVKALKEMGYRLEIVTARTTQHKPMTDKWLAQWLPGAIDNVHYTGEFEHHPSAGVPPPPQPEKKFTKADILTIIGAKALIDDSIANALLCAPVVPVLVFGDYEWNKRLSLDETAQDRMSYSERKRWEEVEAKYRAEKNGGEAKESDWSNWWEREDLQTLPTNITRVSSWSQVVEWFKSSEGRKALGCE